MLVKAVHDRHHSYHTLVFIDSSAQARMLVLRDACSNQLWFHTHINSQKIANIRANPTASVLGYCKETKQQLRLMGRAKIICNTPENQAKWQLIGASARRCYLTDKPGMPLARSGSGYPREFDVNPDLAATEFASNNFARIMFEYEAIDYLHLASSGHRRASFKIVDGVWQYTWTAP